MTPEAIARAHQFREGFDLVDYGEVGLPIFRLTLDAITLAQRRMPTVQEFAMRCISLGIATKPDIARTLGLQMNFVEASVGALVDAGYVAFGINTDGEPSLRLTEAGETRLKDEIEELPQDETLVIDYDAIQRTTVKLAAETVLRASDLRGIGAIELRPYPADPPPIAELSINDVTKVVRRSAGDDFRRTVLALKRVGRRTNLFREGVALVYVAKKSDEVQIAFVIGGKLSEAHERAYSQHGGPKKMGFVKAIGASGGAKPLERLVGKDALRYLPAQDAMGQARQEEADALAEIAEIEPAVQALPHAARKDSPAAVALDAARQRLILAQHAIAAHPLRPLACYEQDELLDDILRSTKRSLFVTSAGLQGSTVNGFRVRAIDALIDKGVDIEVRTFLTPSTKERLGRSWDPLAELTKRAERGVMRLEMLNQTELFLLVSDGEIAVISNRPFLGEVTRRSGFTRVTGLVIRDRSLIAHLRETANVAAAPRRRRD